VADSKNWHRIDQAPKGIGPLRLRAGSGPLDPAYVGYEADDGRWIAAADNRTEVHPSHFAEIPPRLGLPVWKNWKTINKNSILLGALSSASRPMGNLSVTSGSFPARTNCRAEREIEGPLVHGPFDSCCRAAVAAPRLCAKIAPSAFQL
jgi:hypothetical protein